MRIFIERINELVFVPWTLPFFYHITFFLNILYHIFINIFDSYFCLKDSNWLLVSKFTYRSDYKLETYFHSHDSKSETTRNL